MQNRRIIIVLNLETQKQKQSVTDQLNNICKVQASQQHKQQALPTKPQ